MSDTHRPGPARSRWVALLTASVVLAACGGPAAAPSRPRAARVLEVAMMATRSGPGAGAGGDALRGAQLAAAQVDAAGGVLKGQLEIVDVDDRGSAARTGAAVRQLLARHPVALLGPLDPAASAAAAALARRAGVPFVGLAAGGTSPPGTALSLSWTSDQLAAIDAQEIVEILHATSVAVVGDPSAPTAGAVVRLTVLLRAAGVQVAAPVVLPAAGDPGPALSTVAAGHPDVVVLDAPAAEAGALVVGAGRAGLGGHCLLVDVTPTATAGVPGADRTRCVAATLPPLASLPGGPRYVDAYIARYHRAPGPWGALAADAVTAVAGAVTRAGSADRARVAAALIGDLGASGVTGDLTVDPATGDRRLAPLAIVDVDAGGVLGVDPAWAAFAAWPPVAAK